MKHKSAFHPVSFSASFLLASANFLINEPKVNAAMKILSALSFAYGIYNLHQENRLAKAFRPLTNRLSDFWAQTFAQTKEGSSNKECSEVVNIAPVFCK